jgi:putative modified peptide
MASVSADPQAVSDFIRRLASDDAFRAQLEQDPATVLAQNGISIVPLPASLKLPPKAVFVAALQNVPVASPAGAGGVQIAGEFYAFLAFFAFAV